MKILLRIVYIYPWFVLDFFDCLCSFKKWTSGSLCPSTENSLCNFIVAQVTCQKISIVYCRAKIKKYLVFFNFCPTIIAADFLTCNLRYNKVAKRVFRRRTQRARRPFMNVHKQLKKSKTNHG